MLMKMPSYTKKRQKRWHDKHILSRTFNPGQKVLLFNSRLRLFLGKLKSKWSGPFEVVKMTPHGAVELWTTPKDSTFLVNGQRLKHYFGEGENQEVDVITLNDE